MITDFRNKRVTVAGLGRFGGGIAVAQWLTSQGANVLVTDQATEDKLKDSLAQLTGLPITYRLGQHLESDFTDTDLVVASPAIPLSNPFLEAARNANVPISTEMKLFIERLPRTVRTLGVTGTKGKSTTTTMLGLMLKTRFITHVGGNIGKSLLADLHHIKTDHLVLLELSSYMLEHLRPLKWSPHVAIFTMISQDHIEWHGSVEAYVSAKAVLAENQAQQDFAIYNESNALSTELAHKSRGRKIPFGPPRSPDRPEFALKLPGAHNQYNAQAAFAAAACLGVSYDEAQRAVKDFPGLPHRLQLVHEAAGIRYINDSIATIPEAAIAALDSFPDKKVIQIVGGYDKHLDPTPLLQALNEKAKAVLCVGATGPVLAQQLATLRAPSSPQVHNCGDLHTAMAFARRIASPGDIVLLSTGHASYDQFANFEKRGQAFAELAKA